MTQVFRKKIYPNTSEECLFCQEGEKDCKHLFFQCPFATLYKASLGITSIGAIYVTNSWDSVCQDGYRRKGEGGRILAVTWAI